MDVIAHSRYGALTAAQVSALDTAAIDLGVDILQLMEVAGFQVARLAWRMLGSRPRRVHVVAGHGNNGGDALVAARHLSASGCAVSATVHVDPSRLGGIVKKQAHGAGHAGVAVVVSTDPDDATAPAGAALFIDGLLGTGLSGPVRPAHAAVIERMGGTILSIDVPSGIDADEGIASRRRGSRRRDVHAHRMQAGILGSRFAALDRRTARRRHRHAAPGMEPLRPGCTNGGPRRCAAAGA